jgi:hypothetical protein
MNAMPKLPRRHPVASVLAAVLSVVIVLALLGGVTESFQRDGAPFEQLVAAEHACTDYAYVSEREECSRVPRDGAPHGTRAPVTACGNVPGSQ